MINLLKNQSNTIYSFLTSYTGVAPYTFRMVNNIDRNQNESFVLTLAEFGKRVQYDILPTKMLGTYDYTITDTNGKEVEIGLAEITE